MRLLFYALGLATLCVVFAFRAKSWTTNDDAMMAMIAHGYGITDTPSPGVVYSNIVWGWLIEQLGLLFGPYTYPVVCYCLLLASILVFMLAFQRARTPAALATAVIILGYYPVISGMQFTVLAGALAASGLALAYTLEQRREWGILTLACAMLVLAGLIRGLELIFVLCACLPFFWFSPHRRSPLAGLTPLHGLLIAMVIVLLGCHALDTLYYSKDGWPTVINSIGEVNKIVSFRLGSYFQAHPGAMTQAGFTKNDLSLLDSWFFADPSVFDADRLKGALDKVHTMERLRFNMRFHKSYLHHMFRDRHVLLLLGTLAVCAVLTRKRLVFVLSACVLVGAMFVFFLLGHLPTTRVCIPVMLAIAGFAILETRQYPRPAALIYGFICAAAMTIALVPTFTQTKDPRTDATREALCALPTDHPMVVWGVGRIFAYGRVFTPFSSPAIECGFHFYPLGSMQLISPVLDQLAAVTDGKRDLTQALKDGQVFYLITNAARLERLKQYFQEHYGLTLSANDLGRSAVYHDLYQVQIIPAKPGAR